MSIPSLQEYKRVEDAWESAQARILGEVEKGGQG
jgi:hypothetical protein